jgi:hypothetical protein
MKELHEFIPSPRAGKRFINIYRLLRASVEEAELEAFAGNEQEGVYQVAMLLLAILTGFPNEATELLRVLLDEQPRDSWWEFVSSLKIRVLGWHSRNLGNDACSSKSAYSWSAGKCAGLGVR